MDIHVAVEARLVIHSRADCTTWRRVGTEVMAGVGVALLTESGRLDPEQLIDVRAVSLVAVQAILQDRRMLKRERPALVRMAARAFLADGDRVDKLLGGRPVWIVAARAGDLSGLPARLQGHVRGALELHGPHLVALTAQVVLDFVEELPARVVLIRLDDL